MAKDHGIKFHFYDDDIKFNDALVIVSHPTIGMISSITANYLIEELNLKLIGAIIADDMHPAAIVHNGTPLPPIRIYSGEYIDDPDYDFDQLVVIASDLPIEKDLLSALADSIMEWCGSIECRSALTIEGINKEKMDLGGEAEVYHVGSNETVKSYLGKLSSSPLTQGMVSGLSGLLLFRGNIRDFPVISLLSEAHKNFPDSRSAAAVLSVMNILVPKIEMDPEPLLKQAEKIEERIRGSLSQIRQGMDQAQGDASQGMFA